jgi:Flp pilus assembly protein TadG
MRLNIKRTKRGSKGQAAVEFALTIVFVMILIIAAIEMILLIYTYSVLADAAKEGVRYAVVHGYGVGVANCSGPGNGATACTDSTGSNVINVVKTYASASFHDSNAVASNTAVSYLDGSSVAPSRVQVTVSYPYQPIFGLGWPTVTVYAASEGRIVF